MDDLIKALQIFRKYSNEEWPTHCEHDILYVCVDPSLVSDKDKEELEKLSFTAEDYRFYSFRFGSN